MSQVFVRAGVLKRPFEGEQGPMLEGCGDSDEHPTWRKPTAVDLSEDMLF